MKIAFLDRDGTINRDYPDDAWKDVRHPELLPGAVEGMRFILGRGYQIILVSNQYLIGEGVISPERYARFHHELIERLQSRGVSVLDVFFCPHARAEHCDCCKPRTGLILQAMQKYPSIDLSQSFMCGDSMADLQCAENAGLRFYGINIGESPLRSLEDLRDIL